MAASKPTYLYFLEIKYSFSLNFYLRTLAYDLGCFPFDLEPSRPKSVYFLFNIYIMSFTNVKEASQHPPRLISALPKILLKNTLPK